MFRFFCSYSDLLKTNCHEGTKKHEEILCVSLCLRAFAVLAIKPQAVEN